MQLARREFLGASAVMLAPLMLSKSLLAGQSVPQMKLGLVTYNWGKNWDLPTVIENCSAANFSGVELRSTHKHGVEISLSPQERKEVRKRFEDSDVEFVGPGSACEYHSPDPAVLKRNIEETKEFIKLSADCGGTGVKVRPNGLPKEVPVEKTVEQIGKSLAQVGDFAAEHGQELRVEVHGHGSKEIPIMHQIMQAADHPQVKVCWNCNPTDLNGKGLESNFNLLADDIATVHIHDLTKNSYPWPELFTLLNGIQFSGWTLIEDFATPKVPVPVMQANRKVWEELVDSQVASNK